MEKNKIIRAADYLPEPEKDSDGQDFAISSSEGLVYALFGDFPNYADQKYEAIWQEVFDADESGIVRYCLEKNVDVIGGDGKPVSGWRDIAVMLKAIDRGLLKLEDKP